MGQRKAVSRMQFKNILFLNHKAQSFYIWYITLIRHPLPTLFKLGPSSQKWPRLRGHKFTLKYVDNVMNQW